MQKQTKALGTDRAVVLRTRHNAVRRALAHTMKSCKTHRQDVWLVPAVRIYSCIHGRCGSSGASTPVCVSSCCICGHTRKAR